MTRTVLKAALGAACALVPLLPVSTAPAQAQAVTQEPREEINLSIGRGHLLTIPGRMSDVFIANEAVADVKIKSARQLYLFGRSGGETTVYASNSAGDIIWSATVRVGNNINSLDQMLSLAMPDATIGVATMGSNALLLTGTVASPEDVAEAERLVQAFSGDDVLVVSRLKMSTPQQVNLQVRIAEVSRSLVRSMGANLATQDKTGGFQFGIGQGRGTGAIDFAEDGTGNSSIIQSPGGTTIGGIGKLLGLDIGAAFDLAERNGLVTTLSQPNLTALSGETAEFLAGGEYPIPISEGFGTVSIEYRKYGVSLAYTPTVLSNGRISMRVRPEVSELSSEGAVSLGGYSIPALTIRRAETTVELGSGQSFMIAGLLSNNAQKAIDKAPGLGDLPVLGNLFKSREFQKGQTELVIVVTPYLVKPVNANDIKLPTDGFESADAAEHFFNIDHDGRTGGTRPMPQLAPAPAVPAPATPSANSQADDRNRENAADPANTPNAGFSFD
ncbi:type II and III secretion system protein family protein [Altericroceibacterium endophyticum]|uniref:Secretion system protein n=1 Tax=Altericroceibacterium endophyticum TaxID=1808508 RepID=A0A6I4T6P9_9SPHN|nr:type II and III secretion system protein family protein [Altericroceibacterium endophyticum]MXO66507.1 secretion system protein [Altericroceibacterium endophyticum]